jgi:hypothetical protein
MTQLQNKIGSLEAPPKIHRGYSFARWLVTALYVLMFIGSNLFCGIGTIRRRFRCCICRPSGHRDLHAADAVALAS